MDELKEKVLEIASQDEEFAEKLKAAGTEEAVVELLVEKGLDVTAEDLKALAQPAPEGVSKLSEDELDAVAGGGGCFCVAGGGGTAGTYDRTCACVMFGWGYYDKGQGRRERCECCGAGNGDPRD